MLTEICVLWSAVSSERVSAGGLRGEGTDIRDEHGKVGG